MTKQEMFQEIGNEPLTFRRAVEISIKKWKNIMDHWDEICQEDNNNILLCSSHRPNSDNCALCTKFLSKRYVLEGCTSFEAYTIKEYNTDYEICPLKPKDKASSYCTGQCSQNYTNFIMAVNGNNKELGAYYANKLVQEMEQILLEKCYD